MSEFFGRRPRSLALGLAIVAVAIFAFSSTRLSTPALAESDSSPYTVPLVDDTNPDPDVIETTLSRKRPVWTLVLTGCQRADLQRHRAGS